MATSKAMYLHILLDYRKIAGFLEIPGYIIYMDGIWLGRGI
jgi:hypothetical protein